MVKIFRSALIAIAAMLAIAPSSARAKVTSISLDSYWDWSHGRYVSRDSGDVFFTVAPLVMESVRGNPLVQIHLYMAEGTTTDPAKFTHVRTISHRFIEYDIYQGEEREVRLDKFYTSFPLDTLLRDLRGEHYSFHVTADDGEGETAPSNVITFDFAPPPASVVSAPVIEEITSPAIGLALIRLAPMRLAGPGLPAFWFNVYRADGTTVDPADFSVITLGGRPYDLVDSLVWGIEDIRQIAVARVKSGEASFYVTVKTEPSARAESLASNIMAVRVMGSRAEDDPVLRLAHIDLPSGVADARDRPWREDDPAIPNPATGIVRLPLPRGSGDATVRIVSMHAVQVLDERLADDGGYCTVDISRLPAGSYWASISRGERSIRRAIVIVR